MPGQHADEPQFSTQQDDQTRFMHLFIFADAAATRWRTDQPRSGDSSRSTSRNLLAAPLSSPTICTSQMSASRDPGLERLASLAKQSLLGMARRRTCRAAVHPRSDECAQHVALRPLPPLSDRHTAHRLRSRLPPNATRLRSTGRRRLERSHRTGRSTQSDQRWAPARCRRHRTRRPRGTCRGQD
jgi:hypothetical protein